MTIQQIQQENDLLEEIKELNEDIASLDAFIKHPPFSFNDRTETYEEYKARLTKLKERKLNEIVSKL